MNININQEIIREIMNEKSFEKELREFLNDVIDEEINKFDNMDDELISQCIDALYELDNGDIESAMKKLSKSSNIINFCHRKNYIHKYRARTVAAVAAVIMMMSSFALPVFGEDRDSTFIQWVMAELEISAKDKYNANVTGLKLEYRGDITSVDKLTDIRTDDIKVLAYYNNSSEPKEVALKDCKINITTRPDENSNILVLANVEYSGFSFSEALLQIPNFNGELKIRYNKDKSELINAIISGTIKRSDFTVYAAVGEGENKEELEIPASDVDITKIDKESKSIEVRYGEITKTFTLKDIISR